MRKEVNKSNSSLVILLLLLQACGTGNDGLTDADLIIDGAAQKGPFIRGSSVLISKLASNGDATSKTTVTETKDDLGNFSFTLNEPGLVQLVATGYHFNEITGKLSNSTLTLRAIYNANNINKQKAYINVLTHLISPRIIVLIKSGMKADMAIALANTEITSALTEVFPIEKQVATFTDLSIFDIATEDSLGNALLLAVSASLYQLATNNSSDEENIEAELSSLLNTMADDLAEDGKIDNNKLILNLTTASRELNPNKIRAILKQRAYSVLDSSLEVPDINRVLDSDGDGLVNVKDGDANGDGVPDEETKGLFTEFLPENYFFYDVTELRSGGFMLAGRRIENKDNDDSINGNIAALIKLDENGYIIWKQDISHENLFSLTNIHEISKDEYLLAGFSLGNKIPLDNPFSNTWSHEHKLHIFKMNTKAEIVWSHSIDGLVALTPDFKATKSGFLIRTVKLNLETEFYRYYSPLLIMIDDSGELAWQHDLAQSIDKKSNLSSIIEESDGNFTLIGKVSETIEFANREEALAAGYTNNDIDGAIFTPDEDGGFWRTQVLITNIFRATLIKDGSSLTYKELDIRSPFGDYHATYTNDDALILYVRTDTGSNLYKLDKDSNIIWERRIASLDQTRNKPHLNTNDVAFIGDSTDGQKFIMSILDFNGELIIEPTTVLNLGEFDEELLKNTSYDAQLAHEYFSGLPNSSLLKVIKTKDGGYLLLVKFSLYHDIEAYVPLAVKVNADGKTAH